MRRPRGGPFFVLLTAFLVLAPPALAGRPAAGHAPYRPHTHTQPLRGVGPKTHTGLSGGSRAQSLNWSGYDVTGGPFTTVTATWVQPRVKNSGGAFTDAAFWVGLDGDGSDTVEQIGTEAYSEGQVGYDAWYEMYPDYPVTIGMSIHPGDVMTATVTWAKPSIFTLTLDNETTGKSYSTSQVVGIPPALASAEVIAEAPSSGDDVVSLSDYTLCRFTDCAVDGQPIGSYDWTAIDMVTYSDRRLSVAMPLDADGAGFGVTTDATAPRTTARGADAWSHKPVTVRLSATDGGTGVAATEYSTDAGVTWTTGTSLTIDAPSDHSGDGVLKVLYRSSDRAGNVEKAQTCRVRIDTQPPTPLVHKRATVASGGIARLQYAVLDPRPGSPSATVRIVIKDGRGAVVRHATLERRKIETAYFYRFRCDLAPGVYGCYVSATDAAGNRGPAAAAGHLVVH